MMWQVPDLSSPLNWACIKIENILPERLTLPLRNGSTNRTVDRRSRPSGRVDYNNDDLIRAIEIDAEQSLAIGVARNKRFV